MLTTTPMLSGVDEISANRDNNLLVQEDKGHFSLSVQYIKNIFLCCFDFFIHLLQVCVLVVGELIDNDICPMINLPNELSVRSSLGLSAF